jgi:hypothetical protein
VVVLMRLVVWLLVWLVVGCCWCWRSCELKLWFTTQRVFVML